MFVEITTVICSYAISGVVIIAFQPGIIHHLKPIGNDNT